MLKKGVFTYKLRTELNKTFFQLREELDDHLTSINENTSEIQTNLAYLEEINQKIEKLSQRLDHLQMLLSQQQQKSALQPLTQTEKQIFLALYTEEMPLSYEEISAKSNIPLYAIRNYLTILMEKGIPIIKTFYNNKPFLRLDPQFKELQARENIINISLTSYI